MSEIGVGTVLGLVLSALVVAILVVVQIRVIASNKKDLELLQEWLNYEKEEAERFEDEHEGVQT